MIIDRKSLAPALKRATRIADSKSTMPILGCVIVRTGNNKVTLTATDLNISTVDTVAAKCKAGVDFAVDAKSFATLIERMPGDEVTIEPDKNGWITVKSGKVKATVVGTPAKGAPKIASATDAPWSTVSHDDLAAMLDRAMPSICNDVTRIHLNGVMFERKASSVRMVSTDGHRLAKVDRKMELTAGPPVIIPAAGCRALRSMLSPDLEIAIASGHLFARADGVELAIKLIDATFPPYDQVIPKSHTTTTTVDRLALLESIGRSTLMASESIAVKLVVGADNSRDAITITCVHPDRGSMSEDVTADVDGPASTFGLNPAYVRDILEVIAADQVTIGSGGPLDPITIKPVDGDDAVFVIMPMRV